MAIPTTFVRTRVGRGVYILLMLGFEMAEKMVICNSSVLGGG